jgi:arsenate reductase
MPGRYNVLFLCTGNSARSIMGEAILNGNGKPFFTAYSAGSHQSGESWEEFASPTVPEMNFVFTVCDNAAQEMCPVWPGQPMTAHWGVPDPAVAKGTPEQIERAFRDAYLILERRISLFLCLPLSSLDKLAIQKEIDRIGLQSRSAS